MEQEYQKLEQNLIDLIKEEQMKLGYQKETIRLYYPADSLLRLLGKELSIEKLQQELEWFGGHTEHLGNVTVSHKKDRFCLCVPPEGAVYVHEQVPDNPFLKEWITAVSVHGCTLEKLLEICERYSNHTVVEQIKDSEFDVLIYFADQKPDAYYYCVKFEGSHVIYHRFTKEDYEEMGF
ncbi:DUF3877 family protein [Faecalimonas umbilicata]|uniref:DUF3877 family protein n=1 Tax=Faecalimonas umbilicata TaxID=1912855 RepID=UPI002A7EBFE4|nr:DUF3877 family protein [Faecalimonas umbilicata]MDY4596252.1 DUF3877 family protein [Faecalimonas umbilicata]